MSDAAWRLFNDVLRQGWCDSPCYDREDCKCADAIQAALDKEIAAEREACAKIADAAASYIHNSRGEQDVAETIAENIRERNLVNT